MDNEVIAREYNNFSTNYSSLRNLLVTVMNNGKITQEDFYDIEQMHNDYANSADSIKKALNITQEEVELEKNRKKYALSLDDVLDILTEGGKKTIFYKDDDGNVLIDGANVPALTLLAKKLELIATDGEDESSITLTPKFIQMVSEKVSIEAQEIHLEGYTTINEGFAIDESGNMIANNGSFNGEVNAQGNMTADTLTVREIICKNITGALQSDINVSISDNGDDASILDSNVDFSTVQGFLDALPKNLNGNAIYITVDKVCTENLNFKGFSNGDIYLYMNMKDYKGYIAGFNCTAKLFIYGATTVTGIPDGADSVRPKIMPTSMVGSNMYYYGMYFSNCSFVTLRSLDVYGQTTNNNYYAIGAEHGSKVLMQNCKILGAQNGVQARGSKIIMYNNFGKVNNYAARAIYGGEIAIQGATYPNGSLVHDDSSIITYNPNVSTQDGVTTDVGNNTNTGTTTTKTVTYTSDYGDTYRYTWNDWGKDNLVIQGKWKTGTNNVGCWFFGSDFANLQGKTIIKVVLKITRVSGGSSQNNQAKIVMHNHKSRPAGEPSYLGWSKTANLTMDATTTVTITDHTVLDAIANGTMKGFGLKHSYSDEYYMKCNGSMKVTVTYAD